MKKHNTGTSQALLDLENNSCSESSLLVCKSDEDHLFKKLEAQTTKASSVPLTRPTFAPPPPSQVIGKVRDFLGIMEESNKKLQQDLMNSKNVDIEALTGDESEYIEMDLMLGVADLNTPEAVAAAESAIVGSQPIISLDATSSESDSEDSSDDDANKGIRSPIKSNGHTPDKLTKAMSEKGQRRKRSKILELS